MIQQINTSTLYTIPAKDNFVKWVNEKAALLKPTSIHWVDASQMEYKGFGHYLIKKGTFPPFNREKWSNSIACFSNPRVTESVEYKIFIV